MDNDNTHKNEGKNSSRTRMSRGKILLSFLEFLLLLVITFIVPMLFFRANPEIMEHFRSIDSFNAWIAEYKEVGLIVYGICQVAQIIISVLPGQVVQIAGGYLFGFLLTFIISVTGAAAGTLITFYLSRLLGRNAVMIICGEKRFQSYQRIMSTSKARKVIFLIYLIPGLPKDLIAYAAGVSSIRSLEFTFLSLAGRIPAMTVSILFGVTLRDDNYLSAALIAAAVAVIVLICIIKRRSIRTFIERAELKGEEIRENRKSRGQHHR